MAKLSILFPLVGSAVVFPDVSVQLRQPPVAASLTSNGQCLEGGIDVASDFPVLIMQDCVDSPNQKFESDLFGPNPPDGGVIRFNDSCVEAVSGTFWDGAQVWFYKCDSSRHGQQWTWVNKDDPHQLALSSDPRWCLEWPEFVPDGQLLPHIAPCANTESQQWTFHPVSSDKHLTVGCPGVSFHQVANWVVVRGLERLGYTVSVMDQESHHDMYPRFVAGEIDVVTGADLPYNHAPWLWNHTDQFFVTGTVNEATDIKLGVPSYAGIDKVSDLVSAKDDFTNEVLSLDEKTCPACRKQGQDFADSLGWTMRQVTPTDFLSEVQERMGNNEKFAVSWFVPSYIQVMASGLVNLAGDVEPWSRHNVGKVIARFDSADKLTEDARNFLASAFIGNDAIQQMDVAVNDGADPKSAADSWIEANQYIFDSFFGILHDPDAIKFI